jgi:flagellar basal-body rod modification protein FlgD
MEIAPDRIPPPLGAAPQGESARAEAESSRAGEAAAQDFDSFLRLLTAQLRNQDPLQPLDSTEFVAQLASFSTVEQLIRANETLEAFAEESRRSAFADWIGLEAGAPATAFTGTGKDMAFDTPPLPPAETAVLAIRSADGTVLREIPLDPAAGAQRVVWDGKSDAGGVIAAQGLSAEVIAVSAGEVVLQEPALVLREVTGLRLGDGAPSLVLSDGATLLPGEVSTIARLGQTGGAG